MEKVNNLCSVLVTSCDKYEDAWNPFFTLFHKMWPSCSFPIYLNTESKEYTNDSIKVVSLHPRYDGDNNSKDISWSSRLREAVEQIDSKYILFFLEDFFLMSPVREDIVDKCINWMEEEDDVAVIDFYPEYHLNDIVHEEFSEINPKYEFCINTMSALWRRDFLLNILRDESPWDFEFFATERWKRTRYKIYTHRQEFEPVFDYKIIPDYGYGIYQGKWLKKNVELFEKYGISVDFEKRGFVDPQTQKRMPSDKKGIKGAIIGMMKDPTLIIHYWKCLIQILNKRLRIIKAKYFNK